jgi:hypothetical protein
MMKHLSKRNAALSRETILLIIGDGVALLATTLIGFATHAAAAGEGRWLTSCLPLTIGWGIAAPWLGLYRRDVYRSVHVLWRTLLAMLLAAPLAALLRAFMLGGVVIPVFAVVLAATSALAMVIWRIIFLWGSARKHEHR